jgi:hypothetical protein
MTQFFFAPSRETVFLDSASCDFAQDDALRSAQNGGSFFVLYAFFAVKLFFSAPPREAIFCGRNARAPPPLR